MTAWRFTSADGVLTLSRPGRARLDLDAETQLPPLRRVALAHEIRKDLWRAMRGLRGFSPVVELRTVPEGLKVRAGGQVDVRNWPRDRARAIALDMLAEPARRARWIAHAGLR